MSTRSHSTRGRPCESAGYELTASSISSGTLDDPFGQRHFQRTDPEPSGKLLALFDRWGGRWVNEEPTQSGRQP